MKLNNPWEEIDLNIYENHMSLDSVFQLQTMNKMMKDQFYTYPVQSVMILGVAGGNGLEHIDKRIFNKVYGVDINRKYLDACVNRYPELEGIFDTIHADIAFVSDSPYLKAFERLDEVHQQMEETALVNAMKQIGYRKVSQKAENLPNGKKLVRVDFSQ